ncbi:MAG TPA: LacI family DNA-binding transcriptional regulator [Bacillales bacterium]|nr:LacI family DNA-binding transcriptional regulator [Bacillales bacterium]
MATIGDVAELAGLSRATVSRVMNHHPYVSEEKRKLVHEAMHQLGYAPNSLAKRLRTQTTETIAVLIPRISNPFFSSLVEAMEIKAAESDFQLIVCQTRSDKQRELVYLDWLKTKQIGGVILASSENSWEVIKGYTEFGPIMFCNEYPPNTDVPIVCMDQYQGGYLGTRHLIERGHQQIACCFGSSHITNTSDRQKGFLHALEESGLSMNDKWWFRNALEIQDGKKIFHQMMEMDNRPSAIFTGSDEVAAGIIKEAKTYGAKIPNDLAIVGYDDQPIAELMDPGITTIHQPSQEIGAKTMELMIQYIKHNHKPNERIVGWLSRLIVRGST